jgi:hypothetical protein
MLSRGEAEQGTCSRRGSRKRKEKDAMLTMLGGANASGRIRLMNGTADGGDED